MRIQSDHQYIAGKALYECDNCAARAILNTIDLTIRGSNGAVKTAWRPYRVTKTEVRHVCQDCHKKIKHGCTHTDKHPPIHMGLTVWHQCTIPVWYVQKLREVINDRLEEDKNVVRDYQARITRGLDALAALDVVSAQQPDFSSQMEDSNGL